MSLPHYCNPTVNWHHHTYFTFLFKYFSASICTCTEEFQSIWFTYKFMCGIALNVFFSCLLLNLAFPIIQHSSFMIIQSQWDNIHAFTQLYNNILIRVLVKSHLQTIQHKKSFLWITFLPSHTFPFIYTYNLRLLPRFLSLNRFYQVFGNILKLDRNFNWNLLRFDI